MVSRLEIGKDTVQELTESAAAHLGRIASIVSDAVRGVAHELGEWATDAFETREAASRASADQRRLAMLDDDDDFDDDEHDGAAG